MRTEVNIETTQEQFKDEITGKSDSDVVWLVRWEKDLSVHFKFNWKLEQSWTKLLRRVQDNYSDQ